MDPIKEFNNERQQAIEEMRKDPHLAKLSSDWLLASSRYNYVRNFKWLGRPIIQIPTDIVALQELIWEVGPDLIIETGIAHGGSIIFSASMLEILGGDRHVIGIDIDIRKHNRIEIEKHPMTKRITMLEGSSIESDIVNQVKEYAKNKKSIMVFLDSCHTHDHVLRELQIYSQFVTEGSYIVVFDTIVEFLPSELNSDRPWGSGSSPWTAVQEFLKENDSFCVDKSIQDKIILTAAVDGYLKRVK